MLKISLVMIGALVAPLLAWMSVPVLMCLGAFAAVALPVGLVVYAYKLLTSAPTGPGASITRLGVINGGRPASGELAADGSFRAA